MEQSMNRFESNVKLVLSKSGLDAARYRPPIPLLPAVAGMSGILVGQCNSGNVRSGPETAIAAQSGTGLWAESRPSNILERVGFPLLAQGG